MEIHQPRPSHTAPPLVREIQEFLGRDSRKHDQASADIYRTNLTRGLGKENELVRLIRRDDPQYASNLLTQI